jgi:hypothetical protein
MISRVSNKFEENLGLERRNLVFVHSPEIEPGALEEMTWDAERGITAPIPDQSVPS